MAKQTFAKKMGGAFISSLQIEPLSETPYYRQLETKFRQLIIQGKLPAGSRLPSTRTLSSELDLSRTTIKNVFEQLISEGFLVSRYGSGTFVAELNPDQMVTSKHTVRKKRSRPIPKSQHMKSIENSNATLRISEVKAFRPGIPALDQFPRKAWLKMYRRAVMNSGPEAFGFGSPGGEETLKRAIAQHVLDHRGIECTSDQVIITSGIQHSHLLVLTALFSSGDTIVTEDPGQIATRESIISLGLQVCSTPVNAEGLDISYVQTQAPESKAIVLTPSHQHPLGMVTSLARRLEILEYAKATKTWVIEDDFQNEFHYVDRPIPTLFSLDRYSSTVYLNSFSESMFPGLSLGYIICPRPLQNILVNALLMFSQPPSAITQIAMANFINNGSLNAHLRRMKPLYRVRRDKLLTALKKHANDVLTVEKSRAGQHLIVRFKENNSVPDTTFAEAIWEAGIECLPLSVYYSEKLERQNGLLLGFACADENNIEDVVVQLAAVIRRVAANKEQGSLPSKHTK